MTREQQDVLLQSISELIDAERHLGMVDRIREGNLRHIENARRRLRQLQATIDAHKRDLQEHRARQIEEFRRTNEEILRAMITLREDVQELS